MVDFNKESKALYFIALGFDIINCLRRIGIGFTEKGINNQTAKYYKTIGQKIKITVKYAFNIKARE